MKKKEMKNNSKTKHGEKIYIYILMISNNKNNNYDSNNNALKDVGTPFLILRTLIIF